MVAQKQHTYADWSSCNANYYQPEIGAVEKRDADGTSDDCDKSLPVLVRYVDKDSKEIATSRYKYQILAVAQQHSNV